MWEREKYLKDWLLLLMYTEIFGFELRTFALGGVQFCIPGEPWTFLPGIGYFRGQSAVEVEMVPPDLPRQLCLLLYQRDFPGICPPLGQEL